MYSPGNHQKIIGSDDFKGNRSLLIHSNLLNIRAKFGDDTFQLHNIC